MEAKDSGLEPSLPQEEESDSGEVVDLVAALRASVEAAKRRRGEQTGTEGASDAPGDGATKKAATKESAAKKSTAKKTTPKKAASKSTAKKAASSRSSTAKKTTAKKTTAKKTTAQKRKSA